MAENTLEGISSKARILVVDDHPIVRQGLLQLIDRESDLAVCGEASSASEAAAAMDSLRPDIVLADLSLGEGADGLELLKMVHAHNPRIPVLILSMHDESRYAERALRSGAAGYIMKEEATEVLLLAIRRILRGEIYVSERMSKNLIQQLVGASRVADKSVMRELADRELEIFRLIGRGRSTLQIAEALHISNKTVESHQARIKQKLQIKNGRELMQRAVEWVTLENEQLKGDPTGAGQGDPLPTADLPSGAGSQPMRRAKTVKSVLGQKRHSWQWESGVGRRPHGGKEK